MDTYSYCSLLGATAKSPTFSVKHDFSEQFAGGAAVVARHMKTAGADVTFSTVLGDDESWPLRARRPGEGRRHRHGFVDRTRPTTHKERFIADGYKMLQVDRVDNRAISGRARWLTSASRIGETPSGRRDLQRLPPRHLQPPDASAS